MKAVQTWVGVIAIVMVVFVVTLLSQSLTNTDIKPIDGPGPETVSKLSFPVTVVEEGTVSEITPVKGARDFWFENPKPAPLEIGLEQLSCKCSNVEVLSFNNEEEKVFDQWQKQRELLTETGSRGLLPTLVAVAATDVSVQGFIGSAERWKSLMSKDHQPVYVSVPAQSQGLVRLTWEGKGPGPQRLKATLSMRDPEQPKSLTYVTLEMPVQFVNVLQVEKPSMDIEELLPGSRKITAFPVFLPTRAGIRLSAREKTGDPCVQCSTQPLNSQELEFLRRQRKEGSAPVLGGQLVMVAVSERVGEKQLDLGPFQREIVVTSDDTPETQTLTVKGVVMGEVRILGEQLQHRIDFGLFEARSPQTVELTLEAERPTIKLQPDSHYPDYLGVDLKELGAAPNGGRQWKLTVTVPPQMAFGRMPADSVVVLKTQDTPPRRFRIPVAGHGTLR